MAAYHVFMNNIRDHYSKCLTLALEYGSVFTISVRHCVCVYVFLPHKNSTLLIRTDATW